MDIFLTNELLFLKRAEGVDIKVTGGAHEMDDSQFMRALELAMELPKLPHKQEFFREKYYLLLLRKQ